MTLAAIIETLNHYRSLAVFPETDRNAIGDAADLLASLARALNLPAGASVADADSMLKHKAALPEAASLIVRLPSSDDARYDLFGLLPQGLGKTATLTAINDIIRQVNAEDAASPCGGCADGDSVEANVRRRVEALGLQFVGIESTMAWDAD